MPERVTSRVLWGAVGAAFGVVFPAVALSLRAWSLGGAGALEAFASDPLLWIIATAPLFLGAFAAIGGHQHDGLRALTAELEARVTARTQALHKAMGRIQLITDGIADGVVSIDLTGRVEYASRVATDWLGPVEGASAASWIFAEPTPRATLELGLAQIVDDVLPFELCVAQLPTTTRRGGRSLELEYRAIEGDTGRALLIVLHDVTDRLASERAAAESRELQAVFTHILEDPTAWTHFAQEARLLVEATGTGRTPEGRRALHTLKGSAAVFGLARLAARCHELETQLTAGEGVDPQVVLAEAWAACEAMVSPLLPPADLEALKVWRGEIEWCLDALRAHSDPEEIQATLLTWMQRPMSSMLDRLAAEASRVGTATGRAVDVEVSGGRLRAPDAVIDRLGPALLHVVRNAVDHGIEEAEVRRQEGKAPEGHLVVRADRGPGTLVLTVEDDGRGIDWATLEQKAAAAGLSASDPHELVFLDGVSSRTEVTQTSGRGVGMGAARAACRALGGELTIESTRGRGTRVVATVPLVEGYVSRS